jgi:hypothetical protein
MRDERIFAMTKRVVMNNGLSKYFAKKNLNNDRKKAALIRLLLIFKL